MIKKIIYLGTGALYLGQIYSWLADYWWGFELFTHYSLHFLLASFVLILVAVKLRMWKTIPLLLVIFSIHSAQIAPYYETQIAAPTNGPEIKIFSSNFLVSNEDFETIQTVIASEKPDFVQILEASYAWNKEKAMFEKDYPYITISEKTGSFGIVAASKYPAEFRHFTLAGYEALETVLNVKGAPLTILSVHPFPPSRKDLAELRNEQYKELISKINSAAANPIIVAGDFNSAPWSPWFEKLLDKTGLKDAALGFGIINTWNVNIPFLKIPIDHVLASPDIAVEDFRRAANVGADHYPIVATLRLP
ncbi:endonuclease/exonuclease/phosphatase family protein [Candidatus Peregrinibacteria bacterium]|nr:endonuclease/exonuclease/phosphatase family protein [Candidatus Peregrinibacteria bacterium]